ncbi:MULTISPECIES: hypothetical protein [unclassified Pseudoalteromonas]|uniref:hypothetical protein n=1 Tax=unclassified Pseudoalteromonas TaxID=194690 RepID=UPI0020975112|nr:hypothetical protein [Pseudoalteromonas sp. XMcav2-N]MCO7188923.1 hypothetical protein [Pseudoalteromonas sp. XMcav2-N]
MSDKPVAKKLCNFLIENAAADFRLADGLTYLEDVHFHDWAAETALDKYRKAHHGLWVGGVVILTPRHIKFSPNLINIIFHKGDYSLSIPLSHIMDMSLESGLLTNIIVLTTPYGFYRFRCFGARDFMTVIHAQRQGEHLTR